MGPNWQDRGRACTHATQGATTGPIPTTFAWAGIAAPSIGRRMADMCPGRDRHEGRDAHTGSMRTIAAESLDGGRGPASWRW